MATKKTTFNNPDGIELTEEEQTDTQTFGKKRIEARKAEDAAKKLLPTIKKIAHRGDNLKKFEQGVTLGDYFIKLEYTEKFPVDEA